MSLTSALMQTISWKSLWKHERQCVWYLNVYLLHCQVSQLEWLLRIILSLSALLQQVACLLFQYFSYPVELTLNLCYFMAFRTRARLRDNKTAPCQGTCRLLPCQELRSREYVMWWNKVFRKGHQHLFTPYFPVYVTFLINMPQIKINLSLLLVKTLV